VSAVGTVGIVANPAAGKDIRRLVAAASPTSDVAKIGVIRRAVIGAVEGGARRIVLSGDRQQLAHRAIRGLDGGHVSLEVLDGDVTGSGRDSTDAARQMAKCDAGAVLVLGGDGTHRDVVRGWLDAPLVTISTGTNNVFPVSPVDATTAGQAGGLVAAGAVALDTVSSVAKTIHVRGEGAQPDDVALVEVALVDGSFVGSRAVWDPARLRAVVAAIAEPGAVGLSAIAAAAHPVGRSEPGGVRVDLGPGGRGFRVPFAPGLFADVEVADVVALDEGDETHLVGPGLCAFDGERDRVLGAGERVTLTIRSDGPRVIDVTAVLAAARQEGR